MNANVAEGLARLRAASLASVGVAVGCTHGEIAGREAEMGLRLPMAYKEFLLHLGRDAGGFMRGSDLSFDELTRVNAAARELAEEAGTNLPRTAFVFLMHQGYQFLFFLVGEDDDPEVYRFEEGQEAEPLGVRFSLWFLAAVDDEIKLAQELRDMRRGNG